MKINIRFIEMPIFKLHRIKICKNYNNIMYYVYKYDYCYLVDRGMILNLYRYVVYHRRFLLNNQWFDK